MKRWQGVLWSCSRFREGFEEPMLLEWIIVSSILR